MYLAVSHVSQPKRAEFQRSQCLRVLLYLCRHPLTENDEIRHGNTYGEGLVFSIGQLRHCICTNASRGLSAIAEFLVRGSMASNAFGRNIFPEVLFFSVRN